MGEGDPMPPPMGGYIPTACCRMRGIRIILSRAASAASTSCMFALSLLSLSELCLDFKVSVSKPSPTLQGAQAQQGDVDFLPSGANFLLLCTTEQRRGAHLCPPRTLESPSSKHASTQLLLQVRASLVISWLAPGVR